MQDLYKILGVGRDSSNAAIKAAYRELAKQSHPDLHIGDGAAENRTKEINYAYTILGDPEARAVYDEQCDLAAARARKVAFMNNAAIAAGIAFFVIVAAAATLMVSRMHPSQPQFASEPMRPAAVSRIATIGVPETATAHSGIAVSEAPQPGSVAVEPRTAAAGQKVEAPGKEAEGTAPVTPPEAGAPSTAGTARRTEPVGPVETAGVEREQPAATPAVPQAQEPPMAASAAEERPAAPPAIAATQEPAVAEAAGTAQAVEQPAAPAVIAAIGEVAEAGAGESPGSRPEQRAVHRERAAAGKTGGRTKVSGATGFSPPGLPQESEPGWIASRKAMALRWRSTDGPWGEIEGRPSKGPF